MFIPWIRAVVVLLILLPTTVMASEFYVGASFSMFTRTGFIVGYRVDDENSLEAHFGGLPHNVTWGVSLKHSNRSKEYLILGYSAFSQWSGNEGLQLTQGLQAGVGRRIDSRGGDWSQGFEVVGGPGYNFEKKQWSPLISFGLVSTYKEFD